jgi:hypothetical protein
VLLKNGAADDKIKVICSAIVHELYCISVFNEISFAVFRCLLLDPHHEGGSNTPSLELLHNSDLSTQQFSLRPHQRSQNELISSQYIYILGLLFAGYVRRENILTRARA